MTRNRGSEIPEQLLLNTYISAGITIWRRWRPLFHLYVKLLKRSLPEDRRQVALGD